jgi:hypothetical protein
MSGYEQIGMEQHQDKSESRPLDAMSSSALVTRAVADIDNSSDENRCVLLVDLLCAAWPSRWAQSQ